jgi:hypothetical protein
MLRNTFIAIASIAALGATLSSGPASSKPAKSYNFQPAWPSKVTNALPQTQAGSTIGKPREIVVVGSKLRTPSASKNSKRSKERTRDPDHPYKDDDLPAGQKTGPRLKPR